MCALYCVIEETIKHLFSISIHTIGLEIFWVIGRSFKVCGLTKIFNHVFMLVLLDRISRDINPFPSWIFGVFG